MMMTRNKKIGTVLIIIGIFIPVILLSFVSEYKEGAGFIKNLLGLKIMVSLTEKLKIGIPYRFFLALGVLLTFIGIRFFDKAKLTPDDSHRD